VKEGQNNESTHRMKEKRRRCKREEEKKEGK
jgi:hypothetical protein